MEIRKLFNRKTIVIFCFALLTNIIMFIFYATGSGSISNHLEDFNNYKALIQEYRDAPIQQAIDSVKDTGLIKKDNNYKAIYNKLSYINEYHNSIVNISQNAEKLKSSRIFSNRRGFAYKNIIKTSNAYKVLENLELGLDNDVAVGKIAEYYYIYIISFLFMTVIINVIYEDRNNGMWQIVYAGKYGRLKLGLNRLFTVMAVLFVTELTLYMSSVVTALFMYGGIEDLLNPIQTIEAFKDCTLVINKLEFLVINFILSYVSILTLVLFVFVLTTLFRNKKNVVICLVALFIIEYLLYSRIEIQSIYRGFKIINVFNIFKMGNICMHYTNVGIAGFVINVMVVLIVSMAAIILVFSAVSCVANGIMRPCRKAYKKNKIVEAAGKKKQQMIMCMPAAFKEVHKLVFTGKGVWVIIALIIGSWYFSSMDKMTFTDTQKDYDLIYESYGGADYSEIERRVEEQTEELKTAKQKMESAKEGYDNGSVGLMEYYILVDNYKMESENLSRWTEFINKISYIKQIKQDKDIDCYLISDRGYEQIIGKSSYKREGFVFGILIIAVFLINLGTFWIEKSSGVNNIIGSVRRRDSWLDARKLAAAFIVTVIMFIVTYFIEYNFLARYYGMPYLNAPVQSLSFMSDINIRVTISGWIAITLAVKFIACMVSMGLSFLISKFFSRK